MLAGRGPKSSHAPDGQTSHPHEPSGHGTWRRGHSPRDWWKQESSVHAGRFSTPYSTSTISYYSARARKLVRLLLRLILRDEEKEKKKRKTMKLIT